MVYLSQSIVIRDVGEADRAAVSQLWDTSLAEGHFYMACIGARVIGVGLLEELGESGGWKGRASIRFLRKRDFGKPYMSMVSIAPT